MRIGLIIVGIVLCQIAFTGLVSAEVGILEFDQDVMFSIETVTRGESYGGRLLDHSIYRCSEMDDYQHVKSILSEISMENVLKGGDSVQKQSYGSTSFQMYIGTDCIGNGKYTYSRNVIDGSSSKFIIFFEFYNYDVSEYTGSQLMTYTLGDEDLRIKQRYYGKLTSITTNPADKGHWRTYSDKVSEVCNVYQEVDFFQTMAYNYDIDEQICDFKLKRNGLVSELTIMDDSDTVRWNDNSINDLVFMIGGSEYLWVNLTNYCPGGDFSYKIPARYEYEILPGESGPLGNLTDYGLNLTYYRSSILAIPVIGNMSYGYLDFIDSMCDDIYGMGINLLDTLLYPVHLLNDYMSRSIDTLNAVVNDATNAIDVIIQPMVSIVNAIPFKVMNVFLFTLCLDILRILLAWRV